MRAAKDLSNNLIRTRFQIRAVFYSRAGLIPPLAILKLNVMVALMWLLAAAAMSLIIASRNTPTSASSAR